MRGLFLAFSACHLIGLFMVLISFGIELEVIGRASLWILFMNYSLYGRLTRDSEESKTAHLDRESS